LKCSATSFSVKVVLIDVLALPLIEWVDYRMVDERQRAI
jgi:hypothetical protein